MKKKEIIIIVLIITLTLGMAFSSTIVDFFKHDEKIELEEKEEKYITISFNGELLKEFDVKARKGVTFAYIYQFLSNYINSYSIVDIDFKKVFNESETIIIDTLDKKEEIVEEDFTNKLNINAALEKELTKLYGIGDKRAKRIVEYRENKKIESFEELQKLIEVSDYVIEQIKKEAFL
jgi:competence protein ComEA